MQGTGQHGDVIASITNEDGQSIAVFSGFGLGGNGNDFLYGVNSDDVLLGGSGNDYIYGSGGKDILFGGSGGDSLLGGTGNDLLYGGSGKDKLLGGEGSDVFAYLDTRESLVGLADVIGDFTHGVDKIDLSFIDAKLSQAGNQAFGFGGQMNTVLANSVTWYESSGNTIVQIDNTGNNVADMQLVLIGTSLGLTASDFVL
jgi:Ca2+-binding RTX toxin-like protein